MTSVNGSAFGAQSLGLLQISPTPQVDLPSGGGSEQDDLAAVDLSPLVTVGLLNVETEGDTGVDGFAQSSASVADVNLLGTPVDDVDGLLDDLGLGDLLDIDNLLDLGELLSGTGLFIEAVESSCVATAHGVESQTTVVGLDDDDPVTPDTITLENDESIELDLGPLLRVVLNERVVTSDANSNNVVVNGVHITLLGDADIDGDPDALLDVILARSECGTNFVPVTTTSTTTPSSTTTSSTTTPTTVPDDGDNESTNDSDISNESGGTAVIETGDANAVGNNSETDVNQTANAAGGRGGSTGGDASVGQNASVINEGTAGANSGGNAAIGNASVNVAGNVQNSAAASLGTTTTGTIPGSNTARNTSNAANVSDGFAGIATGDAGATGNISDTDVDQIGNAAGGPGGSTGGDAAVEQDATVVNVGDAVANSGGNAAVGNASTNVATNDQAAVAAGADGAGDPCCPDADDDTNTAANTSSASNESDGTAVIETGDANAVGNNSDTEINQTANAAGGAGGSSVPCGGTCDPDPDCNCEPDCDCPDDCPDVDPVDPCDRCDDDDDDDSPCDRCDDDCDDDAPCGCNNPWADRGFGGSSSVNQSSTVVNSGSATANSGGNVAVGNSSTNVATNNQTAAATDVD